MRKNTNHNETKKSNFKIVIYFLLFLMVFVILSTVGYYGRQYLKQQTEISEMDDTIEDSVKKLKKIKKSTQTGQKLEASRELLDKVEDLKEKKLTEKQIRELEKLSESLEEFITDLEQKKQPLEVENQVLNLEKKQLEEQVAKIDQQIGELETKKSVVQADSRLSFKEKEKEIKLIDQELTKLGEDKAELLTRIELINSNISINKNTIKFINENISKFQKFTTVYLNSLLTIFQSCTETERILLIETTKRMEQMTKRSEKIEKEEREIENAKTALGTLDDFLDGAEGAVLRIEEVKKGLKEDYNQKKNRSRWAGFYFGLKNLLTLGVVEASEDVCFDKRFEEEAKRARDESRLERKDLAGVTKDIQENILNPDGSLKEGVTIELIQKLKEIVERQLASKEKRKKSLNEEKTKINEEMSLLGNIAKGNKDEMADVHTKIGEVMNKEPKIAQKFRDWTEAVVSFNTEFAKRKKVFLQDHERERYFKDLKKVVDKIISKNKQKIDLAQGEKYLEHCVETAQAEIEENKELKFEELDKNIAANLVYLETT
ncbi:MAG: hypothetical protein Q8888_02040 [Vigna little leaf phytoplasma]|nr:hypothetical protein [Vigna little leaf phytoplasma]